MKFIIGYFDPSFQQRLSEEIDGLIGSTCRFIFYESTSGIWQSVWLEPVSSSCHVEKIKINTDINSKSVR
jgi:hypothetical protein